MRNDVAILRTVYDRFNARDIDGVLGVLAADVAWANGMAGGHVHGRNAVRDYWTRQWAVVSPRVEPLGFGAGPDGSIVVTVRQTVRDPDGRPLEDRSHGLADRTVHHVFRFRNGEIVRFDIQEDAAGDDGSRR